MDIKIISQKGFFVLSNFRQGSLAHLLKCLNMQKFWLVDKKVKVSRIFRELFLLNEVLNELPDEFLCDSYKFSKKDVKKKIFSVIEFFESVSDDFVRISF